VKAEDKRNSPWGTLVASSKRESILRSWYPLVLSATMADDDRDGLPRPEEDDVANINARLLDLHVAS
jgi:hypothetical protein